MAYEVILPIPVSLEALVDQMAHAAWNALTTGRVAVELYPGYYIPMRQAIEDELHRSLLEEEDLGAAHGYRFAGGGGPGCRLEDAIVTAIASRLPGILGDVRVADIFRQSVPLAVRSVLEPFLWFEGEDDRQDEDADFVVPGPRVGDRTSGVVSSPSGKH